MSNSEQTNELDWKSIAMELAQRVNFAVSHLKANGTGHLLNLETRQAKHWHDYMKEGLEMIPGTKINQDVFMALRLPSAQKKKRLKEIEMSRQKGEAAKLEEQS